MAHREPESFKRRLTPRGENKARVPSPRCCSRTGRRAAKTKRGFQDAARGRVAAPPRLPRGYSAEVCDCGKSVFTRRRPDRTTYTSSTPSAISRAAVQHESWESSRTTYTSSTPSAISRAAVQHESWESSRMRVRRCVCPREQERVGAANRRKDVEPGAGSRNGRYGGELRRAHAHECCVVHVFTCAASAWRRRRGDDATRPRHRRRRGPGRRAPATTL